jgi:transcriptional regulator with XRE-family HTH domain
MITLTELENEALHRLGERLAAARLRRNDRQGDFAVRVGVSIPTYRKMEAGEPSVALGCWVRALRLLDQLDDVEKLLAPPASVFAQLEQQSTVTRRQRAPRR